MILKKKITFIKSSLTLIILKKKIMLLNLYKNNYNGYYVNETKKKNVYIDISAPGINFIFFKKKQKKNLEKNIFFSQFFFFFNKIKFKGKGYKIKINKALNTLNFYFGHSHLSALFLTKLALKRVKKFKFIALSTKIEKINDFKKKIQLVKPLSLYTKRGLRLSRQLTKKRPGKKKTY